MRRLRSLVASVAVPLLLLLGSPADAANADVFVLQGSGTVGPGLTPAPGPHAFSFTGTVTVVGTDGILATYPCSFSGTAGVANQAGGIGFLSGGCGPIQCTTWSFVISGNTWYIDCLDPLVIASMRCVVTWHQTTYVTSYDLICHGLYVRLP